MTTFDVFDSLLTRAVGAPTSVFILLGRLPVVQQLTGQNPEEFARLRVEAERRVRRGGVDVSLSDIYRELGVGLALPQTTQQQLQDEELALETRLSRVVPAGRRLLESAQSGRCVAMSDMYLPVDTVKQLLKSQDLLHMLDGVYVSSETSVMKRNGAMFRHVQQIEGWQTHTWRHIGDDPRSDDTVPRGLGITAEPLTVARLNRYEELWDSYRWETSGLTSLFSGASRLARLSAANGTPDHDVVVDVAAGVAAPLLTAYILWVLRSAQQEGIRRLYFLARDGEVLYQLALRLCARLGVDIDLRYLYGSRYVFHRAALADQDLAAADWAWRSLYGLTNEQVLLRLGLEPPDVKRTLERHGLEPSAETPGLAGMLIGDPVLNAEVHEAAVTARAHLQAYLEQEGLIDGVPFALVDTGWEGRLIQSLHEALVPVEGGIDRAFFLGHLNRGRGFHRPEAVSGYLFDEPQGSGFLDATKQVRWLLEVFCAANHGMTLGFAQADQADEGVMRPILAGLTNPALRDWPWWQLYRDTLYAFVEQGVWDADIANIAADLRRPVVAVLSAFWERPTRAEAAVWGAFPFEDDLLANTQNPLARPIGVQDFSQKFRPGYQGRRVWIPASVQLTSGSLRPLARTGLWVLDQLEKRRRGEAITPQPWRDRAATVALALRGRGGIARASTRGRRGSP